MRASDPDTIVVQANLSKSDYANYFAVVSRRQSDWINVLIYAAAFFAAIPAALLFRTYGLDGLKNPADADLIGQTALFAFMLGVASMVAAMGIMRRRLVGKSIAGTLNAFGPKTATFDAKGVMLTGQIAEAMWRWAAVTDLTVARGLLLIWVGSSVVMIVPARNFGSDTARDAAIAFIRSRLNAPAKA